MQGTSVSSESRLSLLKMDALKSLTTTLLLAFLMVRGPCEVEALRCGDCAADCGSPGVCETKGKCFLRRDVNGLIYRGCADGKRWNGLLYTYNGCQFQNYLGWNGEKVYWCFCDEDNCNDQKMEVLQEKYGVHPLSVTQYSDSGQIGGLLGAARPTIVGPMSDYTQEARFQDVPRGQTARQGQFEGQSQEAGQGQESGFKGQDIHNIGLQGFERKAQVPELNGIPRFQAAGEKSLDDQYATADPRYTSDPKYNAFSPTPAAPVENYFPQKQGAPGYFRYVPSDPDYVQVAPGQGPMTREALLEVLRENGYDLTQHTNDTTNGPGGVVLTYKSPDGSTIPAAAVDEGPNSGSFGLPSNPAVLAPGDILSFLNNLRTEASPNSQTSDTQVNSRVANNAAMDSLGRSSPDSRVPLQSESKTESTTRASIMFTSSETKPTPQPVSVNDSPKQFVTTTESTVTSASSPRQENLVERASNSKPILFDDIVPPTQSVNFLDLLNSMKKGEDGDVIKGRNVTSSSENSGGNNFTTTKVTLAEKELPNNISECPASWIHNENLHSCYKIERQRKTFYEAAYNCTQYDTKAHLISIETEEEYKFMVYELEEQEKHLNGWQGWWTSGVYDPSIREFIWLNTGFVISRLNPMWHTDLLVTPFQQTCVWFVPNAGHPLGNYGCSQSSGFICELELT